MSVLHTHHMMTMSVLLSLTEWSQLCSAVMGTTDAARATRSSSSSAKHSDTASPAHTRTHRHTDLNHSITLCQRKAQFW